MCEAIGHGSRRARQWRIGTDPKREYVSKASEFLTEREHEIPQARLPSPRHSGGPLTNFDWCHEYGL